MGLLLSDKIEKKMLHTISSPHWGEEHGVNIYVNKLQVKTVKYFVSDDFPPAEQKQVTTVRSSIGGIH